jgi:uncharacterized protein YjiS (DUF1127 family)
MITLKMISEKISASLRNRETMREWSQFSDHRLRPIRIRRSNIEDVVRSRWRGRTSSPSAHWE